MLICGGDGSSADYSWVELKKELNLSPYRFLFFEQINSKKEEK